MTIQVRPATGHEDQAAQMALLFYETVHAINSADYSAAQLDAWAPEIMGPRAFLARQKDKSVFVAYAGEKLVGFAELEASGHIDCFYCHKDYQNRGIGTHLMHALETSARECRIKTLTAEVSLTARAFFERRGFVMLRSEEVERRGVKLKRFIMERPLATPIAQTLGPVRIEPAAGHVVPAYANPSTAGMMRPATFWRRSSLPQDQVNSRWILTAGQFLIVLAYFLLAAYVAMNLRQEIGKSGVAGILILLFAGPIVAGLWVIALLSTIFLAQFLHGLKFRAWISLLGGVFLGPPLAFLFMRVLAFLAHFVH